MNTQTDFLSQEEIQILSSLPKRPSKADQEKEAALDFDRLMRAMINQEVDLSGNSIKQPEDKKSPLHTSSLNQETGRPYLSNPRLGLSDPDRALGRVLEIAHDKFKQYLSNIHNQMYIERPPKNGYCLPFPRNILEDRIQEMEKNADFFCSYASGKYKLEDHLDSGSGNNYFYLFRAAIKKSLDGSIEYLRKQNESCFKDWAAQKFAHIFAEAEKEANKVTFSGFDDFVHFQVKEVCRAIREKSPEYSALLENNGEFEDYLEYAIMVRMAHQRP